MKLYLFLWLVFTFPTLKYLPWELYNDPTAVYRLEFRAPMLRSLLHVSDALCFMRALTSALSPGQGLSSRNSKRSELRYKYPSIGSVYDFFFANVCKGFGIICLNATVHIFAIFKNSKIWHFHLSKTIFPFPFTFKYFYVYKLHIYS